MKKPEFTIFKEKNVQNKWTEIISKCKLRNKYTKLFSITLKLFLFSTIFR